MNRSRGQRRKKNYIKARRKKKLCQSIWGDGDTWFKYDGQYIKGKIHCSCPLCSQKTKNNGYFGKTIEYKPSDKKKVDSMDLQVTEYKSA
jgi:hypothetical protein